MNRAVAVTAILALAAAGCAPKADEPVLEAGTPAYVLAKSFAVNVPALDPERTTVLVEAGEFSVTAAEAIRALWDNMGTRTDAFKAYDAGRLKALLDRAATQQAERKILLAAAAGAKAAVPAGELDKVLQAQYAKAGSEQAFLDQIRRAEISFDHIKKSLEESLLINAYLAGVAAVGVTVGEEDLRAAYARDKTATVRHILALTQGKSEAEKAEARTRIEGLLARARAGEDFAELARQHTEDTDSKETGGLYEDFPRGRMVKPFEEAAFSVPVGQVSDVVETTYGYHILKVVERKKEPRPFEEVRAELEAALAQERKGRLVEDHVAALKAKAGFRLVGL